MVYNAQNCWVFQPISIPDDDDDDDDDDDNL
jgi:hypothetical protein